MRVAVNISGFQMREDDLVDRIESALQRNGIQPERFTCEITESVAMEDTKVTQLTFERMRNAGFHVSVDDFGTGYSSLAALRKLPAAELKTLLTATVRDACVKPPVFLDSTQTVLDAARAM